MVTMDATEAMKDRGRDYAEEAIDVNNDAEYSDGSGSLLPTEPTDQDAIQIRDEFVVAYGREPSEEEMEAWRDGYREAIAEHLEK